MNTPRPHRSARTLRAASRLVSIPAEPPKHPLRAITLTLLLAACCPAQTLNLWPATAPGSETWTQTEKIEKNTPLGAVIFNVATPTLTAYLPDPSKATGTGVIIAPGGAFVALAIDLEGHSVARWLQDKGIAAFVLKYASRKNCRKAFPK